VCYRGAVVLPAEMAIRALEGELSHTERSLGRLRAAMEDIRQALKPPPPPAPPVSGHVVDVEAALFAPAINGQRTVRNLIVEALVLNDRDGGLGPMAISGLIHIDKQHINVELAHMAKRGVVTRVSPGRYRCVVTGGAQ
jgi:hypothetical protein